MACNIRPDPGSLKLNDDELIAESQNYLERLKQRAPDEIIFFEKREDLPYILGMSEFIAKTLVQYPKECAKMIADGYLDSPALLLDNKQAVTEYITEGLPEPELKRRLRILRRTRMAMLAWRDLTGRADIEEVFGSLTNLAEETVLQTFRVVRASLVPGFGEALDKDGLPMPLMIMGMGKLGGGELNFSSDIDLICMYPYDGQTTGAPRSLSFREYFAKVVQRSCNLLSDTTPDGFCYRTDLRLRPFGDAGSLVSSFDALQIYYETQGRTWERYALVKAKLLGTTDDYRHYGKELIDMLRPFVYRRYLDYGAIESLRKLKHMIEAEVRRRQLKDNFKLGRGGIREIEFIAQVFELMRGGRISQLQERNLRKTLAHLDHFSLLPSEVCRQLDEDYVYLRRLENVLQELADQQTQTLPSRAKDQKRLALAMNRASYEELASELEGVMQRVHSEFCKVMGDDSDEPQDNRREGLELWESNLKPEEMVEILKPLLKNNEQALELGQNIVDLRKTLARLPMGPVGRETLLRLMPMLIKLVCAHDNAPSLFNKVGALIEKVALRTTYLQLLVENRQAALRLVSLLNDNEFAGALISAHPILMDELIAPHYLDRPLRPDEFLSRLNEMLMRVDQDDLEGQMEELRLFKKFMVLRIAMSDRAGLLPLMKVSDCLTWLAEAIIRELAVLAWNQTVKRFGAPPGRTLQSPGFAIIGYGKLGGLELGYKSDLDMVFIRKPDESMTEGPQSIPASMFYQKMVQRLLHLSVTRMSGGVLYDLDMRLRPDGDAGMLVADTDGFEDYQKHRAWTWEHQALVRARPIAGSKSVIDEFNRIRAEVLRTPRDEAKLKEDVLAMRQKMRDHLDRSTQTLFDLKQGQGGMVDIEFIAQYLLLLHAPKHEEMVLWSDNVRILDECARLGILSGSEAQVLKDAYLAIRGYYHRVSLADLPRIVAVSDKPPECEVVTKIWHKIFEE